MFKLIVKKRHAEATIPKRGSSGAAGYDLTAAESLVIKPCERKIVPTGLSLTVPPGTYGRIAPRSGLAVKDGIDVLAGVVDRDYTGDVGVVLINHSDVPFNVSVGDRVAQFIIEKIMTPEVEEVAELKTTERGAGGFGSTGTHATTKKEAAKEDEEEEAVQEKEE